MKQKRIGSARKMRMGKAGYLTILVKVRFDLLKTVKNKKKGFRCNSRGDSSGKTQSLAVPKLALRSEV
jgi:hypothetical protein